ncbi:hypothetical protein V6N13_096503 [Hibiscus sabdariffa]
MLLSSYVNANSVAKNLVTGEPLIQRKDDTAAVLKSRLEAFHKQTEPVIDYYSKKGAVAKLNAEKPPKDVTVEIRKVIFSSENFLRFLLMGIRI